MPSRRHPTFLWQLLLHLSVLRISARAKAQKEPSTSDRKQIVMTVNTLFAAVRADDTQEFDSVVTSDFYIFDGSVRLNANSLMTLIKAQHVAGKRYEWNVSDPDVHVIGNTAWIAYINEGRIGDLSSWANQRWLESAFLENRPTSG